MVSTSASEENESGSGSDELGLGYKSNKLDHCQ